MNDIKNLKDDPILQKIAQSCVELVSCFFYVDASNTPSYTKAPEPLEEFPLSPRDGYKTNLPSEKIYEMFFYFTKNALRPVKLFTYVSKHREAIIKGFNKIRRDKGDGIFNFNLDPVELNNELNKYISDETASIAMYIIHAFEMFIVYGNFEVEGMPAFVTDIKRDQIINKSELASTVYLLISMHGTLEVTRGEYSKKMNPTKKFSEDVKKAVTSLDGVMRIFVQKQAEPLTTTYSSCSLQTYQPGTLSYERGLCDLNCKKEFSSDCNCFEVLSDTIFLSKLPPAINKELDKKKIPSVLLMQNIFTEAKQDAMYHATQHISISEKNIEHYLFTPGNTLLNDELEIEGSTSPRPRKFIGRIPLYTDKFINKTFETDVKDGFYGIYNLLTGNLFTATKINPSNALERGFRPLNLSGIAPDPPIRYTGDLGLYQACMKIKKRSDEPDQAIPNSPYYLNKLSFHNLILYFSNLGYKNISLFDYSCEAVDEDKTMYTASEKILISNRIGEMGYGLTKKPRRGRRQKRKTRKHKVSKRNHHRKVRHTKKKKTK